jgi:transcriptional regulator with XRE-family HTH domain
MRASGEVALGKSELATPILIAPFNSLDKAGEKGRLSGKYWGEVERSEKSPTLESVFNMADALDVPIHGLVQIKREEDEERIVRKRIDNILDKSTVYQLKRLYC